MTQYKVVFSDVDGTLLNTENELTQLTQKAIGKLKERKIPFVIVSARSPSGIYHILEENDFRSPIIAYSGALILDEERKPLHQHAMTYGQAKAVLDYIEGHRLDASWGVYSVDDWIVKVKDDPRVKTEEDAVKAQAREGTMDSLPKDAMVHKILCMCGPGKILGIEQQLKKAFPELSIVKSSEILLEVMAGGVNKAKAVRWLCGFWGVDIREAIAFGDNYNDLEMLEAAGYGTAMGNAPEDIRKKVGRVTKDNDHDGIYYALEELGL